MENQCIIGYSTKSNYKFYTDKTLFVKKTVIYFYDVEYKWRVLLKTCLVRNMYNLFCKFNFSCNLVITLFVCLHFNWNSVGIHMFIFQLMQIRLFSYFLVKIWLLCVHIILNLVDMFTHFNWNYFGMFTFHLISVDIYISIDLSTF